jgi:hypothetical protein
MEITFARSDHRTGRPPPLRKSGSSLLLLLALACGVAACGGGGGGGGTTTAGSGQPNTDANGNIDTSLLPEPSAAVATPEPLGTTEPQGKWSQVYDWPQVAIHLSLLPNGKLMSWADDNDAEVHDETRSLHSTRAYLMDVPHDGAPGNPTYVPNRNDNLFCSGHTLLPDGRLFVTGGDIGGAVGIASTNIFDFRTNTWQKVGNMNAGRWYPSTITLASGDVLTVSGLMTLETGHNLLPQVWNQTTGWRDLTGAIRDVTYYSPLHVAPNGQVFMSGSEIRSMYLDTDGAGKWIDGPFHKHEVWRDYAPSVMYDNGKIVIMGGSDPPVNTVESINLYDDNPQWQTIEPMRLARRHHNATITADGKVLVTGGTSTAGFNDATDAAMAAESWNPLTGKWTTMASMQVKRVYHSTAVLLPDGRVLSSGGGKPAPRNGTENFNAEIYSPPYLFNGPRPVITSAPDSIKYGEKFLVRTPDAGDVVKATWIRLGSTTHTFNMNQRINHLGVAKTDGGVVLKVPNDPNLTPPGHYMLFLINSKGVPSIAKIMQIL